MKKITLSLALTVMATLAFCQTKIIMEKKNGVYLVPCTVNGLKLKFIFDTGAGDVSISLSEAVFMIKNGYMKEEDLIGSEYYRIANGDVAEGTKIVIRKLEIGNKTLYNVEALIVHNLSAPLLLGQSAIQRFGKFSIDYSTNTLVLGDGSIEQQISNNQTQKVEQNNTPVEPKVDVPPIKTEPIVVKKEPEFCSVCNDKILITYEITNTIACANQLYLEAKFNQCAEEYNAILVSYPNYCVAYYNRGLAKYYAGDKEGAKFDFEKSLSLGFAEAKLLLAKYYGQ
jgi:clan AA aspartic protease (TIGR02281 family)